MYSIEPWEPRVCRKKVTGVAIQKLYVHEVNKYRLNAKYQTYLPKDAQNDAEPECAGCPGISHSFPLTFQV